jgi:hypothetical protein
LTCVQSLRSRRLTGWVAGCGLAAAGSIQVCGGGFSALAGGPSAFFELGLRPSSFLRCRVGPWCPTPIHGLVLRVRHDRQDPGVELVAWVADPSWAGTEDEKRRDCQRSCQRHGSRARSRLGQGRCRRGWLRHGRSSRTPADRGTGIKPFPGRALSKHASRYRGHALRRGRVDHQ